jgi:hypothetical protein
LLILRISARELAGPQGARKVAGHHDLDKKSCCSSEFGHERLLLLRIRQREVVAHLDLATRYPAPQDLAKRGSCSSRSGGLLSAAPGLILL